MDKYEKAIEYLFLEMERGNIKNDYEQEVFETAIEALSKVKDSVKKEYKNPNFKYEIGTILPNNMEIVNRRLVAKNDARYSINIEQEGEFLVQILKESEIDDIIK
ncbi:MULTISPECIES: hypothetical protein [unclassified Clostridium]|uniref:hypothetical protein n=1 Tax=unclassified Clostridium TaxID=2614128 RepID=UPI00207ABA6F|nr:MULTISPECIES: hypothetical protein [unclassified Clostridium]